MADEPGAAGETPEVSTVKGGEPSAINPAPAESALDLRRPDRFWLHAVLFGLSFASATIAQLPVRADLPLARGVVEALFYGPAIAQGLLFSVTLMAILVAHEMGHFLVASRNGVEQSLPYFIPAPTIVGTLGAVILMRSQPTNRSVLLKVAVAGPYLGLVIAVPATAWGLAHSEPISLSQVPPGEAIVGTSLLFGWLKDVFAPEGALLLDMHPVAFAGWVGLFLTSLNLLPVAQLDGGHVSYALLGDRQRRLSLAVVLGLFVFGVVVSFPGANPEPNWGGMIWVFWALVLFVVGTAHPPVEDASLPLTWGQRLSGVIALVVFVVTFVPVPITLRSAPSALQRHDVLEQRFPDDAPEPLDAPHPPEEFEL